MSPGSVYHTVQHMAQGSSFACSFACSFYLHKTITLAFSMFYTLIEHVLFDQSEHTEGSICIIVIIYY